MQVEHHDIQHEFPEMLETIQALKVIDPQFSNLCYEYDRLTGNVEKLEEADIPVDDFTFEEMKKRRLKLKDDLYSRLTQYQANR